MTMVPCRARTHTCSQPDAATSTSHTLTHSHTHALASDPQSEGKVKKKLQERHKPGNWLLVSSHKSSGRLSSFLMQHLIFLPSPALPSLSPPPPSSTRHQSPRPPPSITIIISSASETHCSSQTSSREFRTGSPHSAGAPVCVCVCCMKLQGGGKGGGGEGRGGGGRREGATKLANSLREAVH